MKNIEVSKIIDPIPASDGAGVKLKRSIGVEPNYFDPFLMLDEFGSENSEDYIAGFPPHPHRGIETVTYMLAKQLKELETDGIINRKVHQVVPPKVEYSLTEFGLSVIPILKSFSDWNRKNTRTISLKLNKNFEENRIR